MPVNRVLDMAMNSKKPDISLGASGSLCFQPSSSCLPTASSTSGDDEEGLEEEQPSQVSLSQTDEHIRRLDEEGELTEVVGSQSMLSQELFCSSQREEDDDDAQDEEEEDEGGGNEIGCSQATETSINMARRLGLLTQENDVVEEDDFEYNFPDSQNASNSISVKSLGVTHIDNARREPTSVSKFKDETQSETPKRATSSGSSSAYNNADRIRDTPVRESECFGSLLDAVQVITEREEIKSKSHAMELRQSKTATDQPSTDLKVAHSPTKIKESSPTKRKPPAKLTLVDSSVTKPTRITKKPRTTVESASKRKENEHRKAQEIAKRAAALAERTVADPEMAKKLLLSMALVRENPRMAPSTWPRKGSVVPEGFFWAHYPPLEAVLKAQMAKYYELSTTKCQSAQQQAFNNELVVSIRKKAKACGWEFDKCFSDKGLRDRIRCYYKTHIQNAKKRLRTMVRNPTKRANARHLCAHLDLIELHQNNESNNEGDKSDGGDEMNKDNADSATTDSKGPPTTAPATPTKTTKRNVAKKQNNSKVRTTRRSQAEAKRPVVEV